jgi:hypothetical protein
MPSVKPARAPKPKRNVTSKPGVKRAKELTPKRSRDKVGLSKESQAPEKKSSRVEGLLNQWKTDEPLTESQQQAKAMAERFNGNFQRMLEFKGGSGKKTLLEKLNGVKDRFTGMGKNAIDYVKDRGYGGVLGDAFGTGADIYGKVSGAVAEKGLKTIGLGDLGEKAGDALRGTGGKVKKELHERGAFGAAGDVLGGTLRKTTEMRGKVLSKVPGLDTVAKFEEGLANGLADTVSSTGHALNKPVETAKALGKAGLDPLGTVKNVYEGIKEDGKAAYEKGGVAGAAGFGISQIADTVFGGKGLTKTRRAVVAPARKKVDDLLDQAEGVGGRSTKSGRRLIDKANKVRKRADGLYGGGLIKKVNEKLGKMKTPSSTPSGEVLKSLKEQVVKKLEKGDAVPKERILEALKDPKISKHLKDIDAKAVAHQLPGEARFLAKGRQGVLEHLARDGVTAGDFNRIADGLLDTGSIKKEAALIVMPEGSEMGRRFSSDGRLRKAQGKQGATDVGGYWSRGDDVKAATPGKHRVKEALPGHNKADRGVVGALDKDTKFLFTEVAPQPKFGVRAKGGAGQFQPVGGRVEFKPGERALFSQEPGDLAPYLGATLIEPSQKETE